VATDESIGVVVGVVVVKMAAVEEVVRAMGVVEMVVEVVVMATGIYI
jgi:hypothetical protein